jgi:hypothetical protein
MFLFMGVFLVSQVRASGFFSCPSPCEAMFLPRDMESVDDCLCLHDARPQGLHKDLSSRILIESSTNSKAYRCPKSASAKQLHPKSFVDCVCNSGFIRDENKGQCIHGVLCTGKYTLKRGLQQAHSIADCDCQDPYKKDDSTGECYLDHCPRAANYVRKATLKGDVHSLADCDCLKPYTKNPQSGECFVRFEGPSNSSPFRQGYAKSISDCACDWGFVQNLKFNKKGNNHPYCIHEKPNFICPGHSHPLTSLASRSPVNFMDCECVDGFERDEEREFCREINSKIKYQGNLKAMVAKSQRRQPHKYTCPKFSLPMAPHPHSFKQCQCLAGFEPNYGLESCDWKPDYYACPAHSFNPYPTLPALDFIDCHCAKGYTRNETGAGSCDPPSLSLNDDGCPMYSRIITWPVHNPHLDCDCIFGEKREEEDVVEAAEAEAEGDDATKVSAATALLHKSDNGNDLGAQAPSMTHVEKGQNEDTTQWPQKECKPPPTWIMHNDATMAAPANPSYMMLCPPHAVMNNWPVIHDSDCSCISGYHPAMRPLLKANTTQPLGDKEQDVMDEDREELQCVQETANLPLPPCDVGQYRSTRDQLCRYSNEEVRSITRSETSLGKVIVSGNELDFIVVEDDIMVTQGDIAVGVYFGGLPRENQETNTENDHMLYMLHGYYNKEKESRWKDVRRQSRYKIEYRCQSFTIHLYHHPFTHTHIYIYIYIYIYI